MYEEYCLLRRRRGNKANKSTWTKIPADIYSHGKKGVMWEQIDVS